jgi:hypothetical protein
MEEEHTVTQILHGGMQLDGFCMKIRGKDFGDISCDYVGRKHYSQKMLVQIQGKLQFFFHHDHPFDLGHTACSSSIFHCIHSLSLLVGSYFHAILGKQCFSILWSNFSFN